LWSATSAANGEPEQAASDGVEGIVDGVVIEASVFSGADAKEAECGECVDVFCGVEVVCGNLFEDEAVVGFVLVEGPNDVVSVGEREGVRVVAVKDGSHAVGVAGNVEPVAAPAFAVARVVEEAVDESCEGVWSGVVLEGDDLLV
jgi:hypothetical protein